MSVIHQEPDPEPQIFGLPVWGMMWRHLDKRREMDGEQKSPVTHYFGSEVLECLDLALNTY